MKKLFFALVLSLLIIAALGTVASADNGPHGSFSASTDACASCHRAHSAKYGNNGLLIASPEHTCLECHDGTGAGTNVEDGVYTQAGSNTYYQTTSVEGLDGGSLFGGGFVNAVMATTWTGGEFTSGTAATSASTTSHHAYDGSTGTVWGSGATSASVSLGDANYAMECTSCHDPHGNAGYYDGTTSSPLTFTNINAMTTNATKTASYRLLRWQPSGSSGYTAPTASNWSGGALKTNGTTYGWLVPDNFAASGTEWYTIGDEADIAKCGQSGTAACGAPFAIGDYAAGTGNIVYLPDDSSGTQKNYVNAAVNLPYFCAQCHDRYLANSSLRNGSTDQSAYCGAPAAKTVNTVVLTVYTPASGLHPVDSTGCILSSDGLSWIDVRSSGDGQFTFMHSSGEIRTSADGVVAAGTGTSVKRSCVACHVSHGTTANMTDFAKTSTLSTDSSLLRMDNRSMCLRCHASTVGFTVLPTPTP